MGLTREQPFSLPDFEQITIQLLRIITDARGSAYDPVVALLGRNRWYLSAALNLAEPLPTDGTPYSRKIIYNSGAGDAMVAHWRGGERCLPHDHGEAHGIVTVLKGSFFEQAYELTPSFRATGREQSFSAGDFRNVVPGEIHGLRAAEEGVTLHLYAPPVRRMKIYDENSRTIYTVADDCGAWIPADERLIRHRAPLGGRTLHD